MPTIFQEMKSYMQFSAEDSEALRAFAPLVEPHLSRIVSRFYERIDSQPGARAILDGPAQVERLKNRLSEWLRSSLNGPHDETLIDRRAPIGAVHVRIQLPQMYVFAAMNVIRFDLHKLVEDAYPDQHEQRRRVSTALNRLIDVELALMVESYREAELQIRARERRLRRLVENLPVGAVHVEGGQLLVNRAAETITGHSREQLNTIERWFHALYGERAAAVRTLYEADREAGFPSTRVVTVTRGDGSSRLVEFAGHRQKGGEIWLLHDVTEGQLAEDLLRVRVRQQEAVAGLGVFALREDDLGAFLDRAVTIIAETLGVELCKILELDDSDEALLLRAGVGWREGLVGKVSVGADLDSQAGYTLASKDPIIVEDLTTESRFGGPSLLHDHGVVSGVSMIVHGRNRPFGVLGAHTTSQRIFTRDDVTFLQSMTNVVAEAVERQRTQDALRQAKILAQQRGRLAELGAIGAKIVHDLGNPLAGLTLQAQLVQRRLATVEDEDLRNLQEPADLILETARHLDTMIREFKTFVREQQLHLEEIDLARLLQEVAAMWRPEASQRGVDLLLELKEGLGSIQADGDQLRRVFDNLLSNAIDAAAEDLGMVRLVAGTRETDRVRVTFEDTGPGLPSDRDVFALFQTTKPHGTGLGLPIVKQILHALGGSLRHESRQPHGALFHVDLNRRGPSGL
jgi:PAS domain S-box-containing protein